jgi:hypothetical protein
LLHNLLSIREIVETVGGRSCIGRRLGGFKSRDTVGPFPLFSLFAAICLGPTEVLALSAFTVQALLSFLGCRAAADLACMRDAAPRPLSLMGRIGVVWLCGFAPILGWRSGWGHINPWSGLFRSPPARARVRHKSHADGGRSVARSLALGPPRWAADRPVRRGRWRFSLRPEPGDGTELLGGWIIFRTTPDEAARLRPVGRPGAVASSPECYVPPERMDRAGVESLVHWIQSVECFELPMSSLTDAVDVVKRLGRPQGVAPDAA